MSNKKRVLVILLVVVCLISSVSAATYYSSWKNLPGTTRIDYKGRTSISTSSGKISSTATVITTDGTSLPAGYVKAEAILFSEGNTLAYAGPLANSENSTGVTAQTGRKNYNEGQLYYGFGNAEYKDDPDIDMMDMDLYSSETPYNTTYAAVMEKLSTEEKKIRVNENNMTYGKAIVAFATNEQIDLISAIGENGVEGYIYSSQLPRNIENYVPHDHTIPVYASDGVTVVDSFFISSGVPDAAE